MSKSDGELLALSLEFIIDSMTWKEYKEYRMNYLAENWTEEDERLWNLLMRR